ncbi:MAG TPA: DUF2334 domain-containing protein [Verrucomicrobiae bacterium]|nr:DUF2334 domain-containing protein [Verrucomicrobiae bacterium]
MRYVILRDDDTNALTPVEYLERLYRPFLDRGFPVNLAVIPDVATNTTLPDGGPEGFLVARNGTRAASVPIAENARLVNYVRENSGYHVAQHGCHHDYFEFDRTSDSEIARRLDHGAKCLMDAGFEPSKTFVAPYDKFSPASFRNVSKRFSIVSTGWFELRRLPKSWWPKYCSKKLRGAPHWRAGKTTLLSHPGCLLSYRRDYNSMLDEVIRNVNSREITVLVTHWWEYFRGNIPDEPFIENLHQTAEYLASQKDIRVISFDDIPQIF